MAFCTGPSATAKVVRGCIELAGLREEEHILRKLCKAPVEPISQGSHHRNAVLRVLAMATVYSITKYQMRTDFIDSGGASKEQKRVTLCIAKPSRMSPSSQQACIL